jgi:hypothetical protein
LKGHEQTFGKQMEILENTISGSGTNSANDNHPNQKNKGNKTRQVNKIYYDKADANQKGK